MDSAEFIVEFLMGKFDQLIVVKTEGDDLELRTVTENKEETFALLLAAAKAVADDMGTEFAVIPMTKGQG